MKIDLVKINIGDFCKYKFKKYEPCCDEILDNPCIDFTNYNLAKKKHDTLERLRNTDSIKEYDKLLVQKKALDEKINAISELCEYSEEDFKE